ncbi:hypothetical protein Tco_0689224, partial [Tanacetum coccineum]
MYPTICYWCRQPVCDSMSDVGISGSPTAIRIHFKDTMNVHHPYNPSNSRAASVSHELSIPIRSPCVREVTNVNNRSCARRDHSRRGSAVGDENLSSQVHASSPPVGYKHPEDCNYSCQHCGALFWSVVPLDRVTMSTGGGAATVFAATYLPYRQQGRQPSQSFWGENSVLQRDIVEGLIDLLDTHNALVQLFRTARENFEDTNIPNFNVWLYNVIGAREYELPTRDMFPLLFLDGQDGYKKEMKMVGSSGSSSEQKRLTMLAYYSYYLYNHANRYNYLSRAGRLFQQYVVTAFCAVEQNRIDFIREHCENSYFLK